MHYFSIYFKRVEKTRVNSLRVLRKTRNSESLRISSKVLIRFLGKTGKNASFSYALNKDLTRPPFINWSFSRQTHFLEIVIKLSKVLERFLKKISINALF